jgi:hypothetical protein
VTIGAEGDVKLAIKRPVTLSLLVGSVGVLAFTCGRPPAPKLPALPVSPDPARVSFREDVQPVLERRCVVCHACYDAPCQLLLSSSAGLQRGASKQAIYHSSRLRAADPSRLFIDEKSNEAWRKRGFFSVVEADTPGATGSLLLQMLALGRASSLAANEPLPAEIPLDISRELSCPTADEFDRYAADHPRGGMPYAMAPLADAELAALASWASQGASPPAAAPPLPEAATAQVARWESFLNGKSLKERITSRYLYEHWVFAHLYFDDLAAGPFFRIVRSTSPPGAAIDEIATRRPYDDPGSARFWYRLQPVESAIVHKTHIVYALSEAKQSRLTDLFLASDWNPTRLPSYDTHEAANPFVAFDQIPARSRYQFLLDDARYFVMTFIRGPVCRGQVAVDVIEDRFFVAFLDPERDLSVVDASFLERSKEMLSLPAEHGSDQLRPATLWVQYDRSQQRFLDFQAKAWDVADPERRGPTLEFLWDGDGHNRNALLTVFRHFDNATVVRGFLGGMPKTAWVVDFPTFERIYYDLVAGFDVFGNAGHQISTRLYMDHLRMQSENLFLVFLPEERRQEIRASWYVGADLGDDHLAADRIRSQGHATQIRFTSPDVTAELLEQLIARNPAVSGPPDLLNRCAAPPCARPGASALERRAERALQSLSGVRGPWVAQLPDVALLRVRSEGPTDEDAVYTLVRDKFHTNVAFMFKEAKRREIEKDTLTIVHGYLGSYPNFLFDVEVSQVEVFTQALTAVTGDAGFEALVARFGVRRTSPRFWETFDWIHDDFQRRQPTEAGLFDLGRYKNL